ncbi:MAG: prolipoprotein diacylglyceryl transferase [Proteobacteria bacterium]|nr:MAG: prolipoprotein diacylglyceryl transferase [Pseudomonadota bacterium]
MQPILFHLFGWPIQAYGFFIALGYILGLILVRRLAISRRRHPAPYTDLSFFALIVGLIGARALFVLTNLDYFSSHADEIFYFWGGGLVFYGGFLLAFPFVLWFVSFRGLPLKMSLDILAPGLALGHAVGRLGCFFAGCCHGRVCDLPWGVQMNSLQVEPALRGLALHPTQLYEAAGLFLLSGILSFFVITKRLRDGLVAVAYAMGYAILRTGVEFYRGDSIRGTLAGTPFSTSQLIALALLGGGSLVLLRGFGRDQ